MSNIKDLLTRGTVINGDGERGPFKKIEDLVGEWERETYPTVTKKLHMSIKNSNNRMKLICCLNSNNVVEADRLCSFKLLAISKNSDNTAVVSKNACLEHSCQSADFHITSEGRTGRIISSTRVPGYKRKEDISTDDAAVAKKRRATKQDRCKEAWKLLSNEKVFIDECFETKKEFINRIGLYGAKDLGDLGTDHVEYLCSLMKDVPRKQLAKLLHCQNKR